MKLKILNLTGQAQKDAELPVQFSEPVREDLIKKAVLAIQNNNRQAYGSYVEAGKRHSVDVSRRRRDYRGSYGHGISRVPRKVLNHRGTQFFWVGAEAPGTVGGRRAHPPKAEKVWEWKLNVKEKRKAIRSAMSATVIRELVLRRGHKVPDTYPFIITDELEAIEKTALLRDALVKLGFETELGRAEETSNRSGRGRMRGRSKKAKKSLLLVVGKSDKLTLAATNLPGVDVINIKRLNSESLAPGGHYGRATLFTVSAIEELKKGLFGNGAKAAASETKAAPKAEKAETKAAPKKEAKPKVAKPKVK